MKALQLKIESIWVCDGKGQSHSMNYKDRDQISSEEKKKLKTVLHLIDRFYISDAFYHELILISDNLPKSYLIKQLRSDMNTLCHIQQTPGKPEGVEIDVVQELRFAIKSLQLKNPDCKNVTVKFCGDGTSVARNTGMCLMSFYIWSADSNVSTSACHHTVVVVKGQESYEIYRTSFKNVFMSINELFSSKSVEVNGEEVQVNVCMGGDYKFILMVLGMAGATSNYACRYCKIHTNDVGICLKHMISTAKKIRQEQSKKCHKMH